MTPTPDMNSTVADTAPVAAEARPDRTRTAQRFPGRRTEWLRVVAVAAVAALIWITYHERWTAAAWNVPTDYYVDAHETLARLKAASEGDIRPLSPQVMERLGAPFGASWNSYPTPDKPLMMGLGALVHAVGLFAAANIGLLLAQVSAAVAFYLVARWLRCRWEWAAAGALLFAYTYHTFHRGLSHFSLIFTWTVPLGLLAVWIVARSRRLEWHRPTAWFCIAAGVALGVANPYNLFFWAQLMGWAVIFQWFGARRRPNLQIAVAAMAAAVLAFVAAHAESWFFVHDTHALPLLARNYAGTEMYALKPVEMFIPPPYHTWDWLAFFGNRYTRWSGWRGEVFLPYLGLAGIAGFAWLLALTVGRVIRRRPIPGPALSVGWLLGYASIGGLTNLLALFAGFQLFRATNRAAIFISALVLVFLVLRLSRWTVRWPAWTRVAAAGLLAAVGVLDQLPTRLTRGERDTIARMVESDLELGRTLERELPRGAMVFQLPVLGFPEVATPHELLDYELFRPFLTTESLRFSYGAAKARARSQWQRDLEGQPTAEMVRELEQHGFAALFINRKAYPDRGEKLLLELRELGYGDTITGPAGEQVVVKIRPSATPTLPLADRLTHGLGWHLRADAGVTWAYEEAALSYFNPYDHPLEVDLVLRVVATRPRDVAVKLEGRTLSSVTVGTTAETVVVRGVRLAPGVNRFAMDSSAPAVREGTGRYQLRSFGLLEGTVRLTPEAMLAIARSTGKAPMAVR